MEIDYWQKAGEVVKGGCKYNLSDESAVCRIGIITGRVVYIKALATENEHHSSSQCSSRENA